LSNVTTGVGLGISGINGNNDGWTIRGGAFGIDSGYLEIATRDGGNEPIYVRQYTDLFTTPSRTLTLLDQYGNTNIPGNLTALSYSTPGNLIFRNDSSAFASIQAGTSDILIRNLSADGSVIDRPIVIEKFGSKRLRLGTIDTIRPIEMGGPVTILNLSANGFVRTNSSGLLTTSPLTSSEIPVLSNLYLPISGGKMTGNISSPQVSATKIISPKTYTTGVLEITASTYTIQDSLSASTLFFYQPISATLVSNCLGRSFDIIASSTISLIVPSGNVLLYNGNTYGPGTVVLTPSNYYILKYLAYNTWVCK